MAAPPRVSVIMAAYNGERYIADAIRSVISQTYADLELIVIDDGSRDRTREIVGRFADAVESGDVDGMVGLLTDDAWLTMPPLPHAYQGRDAIGAFLRAGEERRGAPLRLRPTRANAQPAFAGYHSETGVARGLFVLTLEGGRISAVTWFADTSVFPHFGLPLQ